MTKQDILNKTGLSEEEFYQRFPDQETFCSEYPDLCPEMMDDEEDMSDEYDVESDDDDSLYEAEDGVETTAPYTDYNQYKNAMQTYGTESAKANTYNNFQNDLYNQSGKQRGFSETPRQMGDMFNSLSPGQQDAMAAKYNFEFVPAGTPSANRRNYINSMEMNVPGKGMGYYSFPTNDVVYGNKQLERPKYDFPRMNVAQYQMPDTPPANFQGKPINYQPGTANINFGNTTPQPKKFSPEPTQLINSISAGYKDPASFNKNNGNLPIPKYSMSNTMEKVGATNKPFVTSTPNYKSIVDLLKARKQDSSFTNRKKLAEERGIKNYTGTASQNMQLINNIDNFNPYNTGMELGGVNIHPAMRTNFKQGGYYGMDGKLHRAKGSGTYVMNGGYYFQPGGTNTAPPVTGSPTTSGLIEDNSTSTGSMMKYDNMPNEDGTINIDPNEKYTFDEEPEEKGAFFGNDQMPSARQQRRQARRNAPYETPDLGGLDSEYEEEQQQEEPVVDPYDASQYSSGIDPATGFTTWSKNNQQLTNIKKQDPALWNNLKEQGKGARFRTGQTTIQKIGRGAGRLANNLEMGANIASGIGNIINNRNEQRNLNNSAINKGSTASMYTNPQGAGKGDYGKTGSSYGMLNPASVGERSFTGMYNTGKYGMEVPMYDVGGLVPQFSTLADVGLESLDPNTFNVSTSADYLPAITPTFTNFAAGPKPIVDNTRVYQDNQKVKYDFSKPLGKGLDVSGDPKLMKELFTYAQNQYGTPDKKRINGINEMAWNPMGVYNEGNYNPKGKWKGHDGHIHFGFENPDVAIDIIKKAQSLGLVAKENPYVDKVDPIHTKGSFHYSNFNPNDYITTNFYPIVSNPPKNKSQIYNEYYNKSEKYLSRDIFKGTPLKPTDIAKAAEKFYNKTGYEYPIELLLSQGQLETTLGKKLKSKNNFFNVGNTDSGAIKNYNSPEDSVYDYMNLMYKDYLQSGKKDYRELFKGKGFVNYQGNRYASNPTYEPKVKGQSEYISKYLNNKKQGGQLGGQVVEMDEDEIKQFLKAGGQLEFLD
jgi:peptidoglycan L-alanyl-D-glutamate endopeptidase CwlK